MRALTETVVRMGCIAAMAAALLLATASSSRPQDEATADDAAGDSNGDDLLTAEELRIVVAPVAFYPDDVLALVLPASTNTIQIVEAQRYLDKHESNPDLEPKDDWDPAVLALLNYPDVVKRLDADLDWTDKLGTAVIDQQADVMDAIQQIRNEAVSQGALKSSDRQVITQEKETVIIQSADPEVVYIPDYDPDVIIEQNYAAYQPAYYPPYPYYYSPAATFFTGAVTGAAFAFAFDWFDNDIDVNWGGGCCGNNININNDIDITNIDRDKIKNKFGDGDWKQGDRGDKMSWKPDKSKRPGNAGANRPNRKPGVAQATGDRHAKDKVGTKDRPKPQNRVGDKKAGGGKAAGLGKPERGRDAAKQGNRGKQSLNKAGKAKGQSAARSGRQRQQGLTGGHGAGGRQAGAHKSRGGKSLGGKKPMKRR